MIDKTYVHLAERKDYQTDQAFLPEHTINYKRKYIVGSDELAVIIPPWHRSDALQKNIAKRLNASGIDVLDYGFDDSILDTNLERVLDSQAYASESISSEIEFRRARSSYEKIHLVSMSMGIVCLSLVAKQLEDFDSATTVVSGGTLAGGLWEGSRTQHLREDFEGKGVTLEQLKQSWSTLEPNNNVSAFAGKVVNFCVSLNDEIVPTEQQVELRDGLAEAGANLESTELRVGHLLSPPIYYLTGSEIPVPTLKS